MFDFIPIEFYSEIYYNFMLLLCLFTFLHTLLLKGGESTIYVYNNVAAFLLLSITLLYIGFRPIHGKFIDMTTYVRIFERTKLIGIENIDTDIGFFYFVWICTKITSIKGFFFLSACIYIIPLFIACKRWFPNYYFFAFLMLLCSFSFWSYGTNGIRNGMAGSLFILAISFNNRNNVLMLVFFVLSYFFHTSLLLPIMAFSMSFMVKDTRIYLAFWIVSIILSISIGGMLESIFANLGFGDDRLSSYLSSEGSSEKFSSTGFRYDFLIYSAAPIALGCFYKFKLGYKDLVYDRMLHTYITANAFWIMVIRANFSNRFAYLSWFFMALIFAYPLLKEKIWDKQFHKLGTIILFYFGFSYLMFYVYKNR